MNTAQEPLSPEEVRFLMSLFKEHVEYYRVLSGSSQASRATKETYVFLKQLEKKLAAALDNTQQLRIV